MEDKQELIEQVKERAQSEGWSEEKLEKVIMKVLQRFDSEKEEKLRKEQERKALEEEKERIKREKEELEKMKAELEEKKNKKEEQKEESKTVAKKKRQKIKLI